MSTGCECEIIDDSLKFRKYLCFVHKLCRVLIVNETNTRIMFLNSITDNTLVLVSSLGLDKMPFCRVKFCVIHSEDYGSLDYNNAIMVIQT